MPTAVPVLRRSATSSQEVPWFSAALRLYRRWCGRYRQRRDLGELDVRLLADIGISREQADEERRKPFWR